MRVVSVNVGSLRTVPWRGRQVRTGIFKHPVDGRVAVRTLGCDGDEQGDLQLHGGVNKAVYVYPREHYAYWREAYPEHTLLWGMFGENLTTDGVLEYTVHIGDRWRIGSAQFEVVQPREPCFKLGLKFEDPKIVKQFLASGRSGWYVKVVAEGEVRAGDDIVPLSRNVHAVTVADLNGFLCRTVEDTALLQRALRIEALPTGWRDSIARFLTEQREDGDIRVRSERSSSYEGDTTHG